MATVVGAVVRGMMRYKGVAVVLLQALYVAIIIALVLLDVDLVTRSIVRETAAIFH